MTEEFPTLQKKNVYSTKFVSLIILEGLPMGFFSAPSFKPSWISLILKCLLLNACSFIILFTGIVTDVWNGSISFDMIHFFVEPPQKFFKPNSKSDLIVPLPLPSTGLSHYKASLLQVEDSFSSEQGVVGINSGTTIAI